MKNKKILIVVEIIIILIFITCIFVFTKKNDVQSISDIDIAINADNGDEKIDWSIYKEEDIELTESMTITEEGVYNLTGTINGSVKVNTTDNVKLILNNVNITSNDGPAIYIEKADDVIIYLKDGTSNTLEDSSTYSSTYTDIDGVIFSTSDLTFDGTGSLMVKANYLDGIVSKDDLKIKSGNYEITSTDDGIRGKDSVYILDGTFDITAGGDAIKSTNDTDSDKGFILIGNGTFNINADLDGIDAQTKLLIKDDIFDIATGGGSDNASIKDNWGMWGRNPYQTSVSTSGDSAKGIKSGDNLVTQGGTFNFNTSDDSIHSNNYVGITNGNINISSGDDGIHADTKLIIESGNINITKSYEGIESAEITINGGNIDVVATDDGINVAGGMDSSATDRRGANTYNLSSNNKLTINGGNIHVNATGDGIDINGSGYVYGGNITVEGPTDSGNGTLDYDRKLIVNAGTFIGSGSSGMAQSISSSSSQYNIMVYFDTMINNIDTVTIIDSDSNEVLEYTSSKKYNLLVFSSDKLNKDSTYTIKINDEEYDSFTISDITTSVGRSSGMGMTPGSGQRTGGRR